MKKQLKAVENPWLSPVKWSHLNVDNWSATHDILPSELQWHTDLPNCLLKQERQLVHHYLYSVDQLDHY